MTCGRASSTLKRAPRDAGSQQRSGSGSRSQTSTLGSQEPRVAVSEHGHGLPAAETQHLGQERWHHRRGTWGTRCDGLQLFPGCNTPRLLDFRKMGILPWNDHTPRPNSQPTQTRLIQRESSEGTRISCTGVVWPE